MCLPTLVVICALPELGLRRHSESFRHTDLQVKQSSWCVFVYLYDHCSTFVFTYACSLVYLHRSYVFICAHIVVCLAMCLWVFAYVRGSVCVHLVLFIRVGGSRECLQTLLASSDGTWDSQYTVISKVHCTWLD